MRISSTTGRLRSSIVMRWLMTIILCLFFLGNPFSLKAANEFHASNEFSYTYNDVSGPGSDRSSLRQGFSYLNQFNINNLGLGQSPSWLLCMRAVSIWRQYEKNSIYTDYFTVSYP